MLSPYAGFYPPAGHQGGLETTVLFDWAYRKGQAKRLYARMRGLSQRLLHLDDVLEDQVILNRYSAGIHTVAIDQIRGSVNKGEFDHDFYPTKRHIEERWASVARALLNDVNLPPVELIQVGDIYFVVDGHHRVSVARGLGYRYLDAVVTRVEVAPR